MIIALHREQITDLLLDELWFLNSPKGSLENSQQSCYWHICLQSSEIAYTPTKVANGALLPEDRSLLSSEAQLSLGVNFRPMAGVPFLF